MKISSEKLQMAFDAFMEKRVISLDKKYKIAIWAVAIILPLAAFYFLFWAPRHAELAALAQRKTGIAKEIREAKARAAELDKHKAEMVATQQRFQEASILLPQAKEIPTLLTSISSLGTNAGLDFVSFLPKPEEARDFYAEIPVDISVRGPYHNVGNFLYQVSKLDRIVSVTNIALASPTLEKGEMLLAARFTLVTYRFLEVNVSANDKDKDKGKKK